MSAPQVTGSQLPTVGYAKVAVYTHSGAFGFLFVAAGSQIQAVHSSTAVQTGACVYALGRGLRHAPDLWTCRPAHRTGLDACGSRLCHT